MARTTRSLSLVCGAQLALIAPLSSAGCGGNVVCAPSDCTTDSSALPTGTGAGGSSAGTGSGGVGGSVIITGTTGGGGTAGTGGGVGITGPALVYPFSFGEDLEVVRISTETLDCSKLNWSISNDNCDWWVLEVGIPVGSFAPGSYPIDFGTFVTFEAAAANPSCIVKTGGGLVYSQEAVLTILEVTDTSVSVELTGVSTEDLNGHDANGSYTALRCDVP